VYVLGTMLLNPSAQRGGQNGPTNTPLPAMTVRALNGTELWNAQSLQGRVTLINFFASWCNPCAAEMPELGALKKQFPKLNMQGIAWNDSPKTLNGWLIEHHNPFDKTWLDETGDATIALGIRGIPETLIVDKKGMVRYRLSGGLTPALRASAVDALITSLLNEPDHAS